jgi:hypothetical protein
LPAIDADRTTTLEEWFQSSVLDNGSGSGYSVDIIPETSQSLYEWGIKGAEMNMSRIGTLARVALVAIPAIALGVGLRASDAPGKLKIVYSTELRGAIEPCG